jgi:hypothetical protein
VCGPRIVLQYRCRGQTVDAGKSYVHQNDGRGSGYGYLYPFFCGLRRKFVARDLSKSVTSSMLVSHPRPPVSFLLHFKNLKTIALRPPVNSQSLFYFRVVKPPGALPRALETMIGI